MRTAVDAQKLRDLLRAYREQNSEAFVRTAENIISDELAANHHGAATELKRALGQTRNGKGYEGVANPKIAELSVLPRERRNGEDLMAFGDPVLPLHPVVLSPATEVRITRLLTEHHSRAALERHGVRPKTKLLFWGVPGTGKTITAHFVARELGLPIGTVRLSALISSFLGDTASHLQRLFDRALSTPMVLFLDEVDAIGKNRDDRNDVGEVKRVVNTLLQAVDAFQGSRSLLIAASNHQYLLDSALWRRFDDIVEFPLPARKERDRFLCAYLNGVTVNGSLASLSQQMSTLSFAVIERVLVESIKTMIIQEETGLSTKEILRELSVWRNSVAHAQRPKRKPSR
jgi:hypothetical protein